MATLERVRAPNEGAARARVGKAWELAHDFEDERYDEEDDHDQGSEG
ncbi:MAG: hypothetical protein ACTHMZ_07420 [Actinomycetes bacterium]